MHQVILEGEAHKKSFGTLFFRVLLKKTICLHRKQLVLVAGSSINAVQSLQLELDGLSKLHMELPYSRKFWQEKTLANCKLNCIWQTKPWRI